MVLDSCLVAVHVTSRYLQDKIEPPAYVGNSELVKAVALLQHALIPTPVVSCYS
jgi:hypothetical protein